MKLPKKNEILKLEGYENILRYMDNFPFEKDGMEREQTIRWVEYFHHEVVYVSKSFSEKFGSGDYQFFHEKTDKKAIELSGNENIVYNKTFYDL